MTANQGYDQSDPHAQQTPRAGQQPPRQGGRRQAGHQQTQPQGMPSQTQGGQPQPQQPPGSGAPGPQQRQQPPQQQPAGAPQQGARSVPQQQTHGTPQQAPATPPQGMGAVRSAPPRAGTHAQPQGIPAGGGMGAPVPQGAQTAQLRGRGARPGAARPLLKLNTIEEVVTEDVITAQRDTPVRTVVAQMAENNVGSVVVTDDSEPIGLITDRKVALALEENPDVSQQTAEDLIGEDLVTADGSMTIFDVLQVMSDQSIRRVPIVDDENRLQGIVTLDDALVLLGTAVGNAAETIQSQIERL